MKKILVPVDFSELSENAANYAVELAKKTNAQLILMHVSYVPVFAQDASLLLPSTFEIEKESIEGLERMKQAILDKNEGLKVSCYHTDGIPVDEINMYAIEQEIDLIVIGAHGTGYLEERLFGSTATTLIRNAATTILVINNEVKFTEPKRIALAVDYTKTDNNATLKPLKQLSALFDSHVFVLNVLTGTRVPVSDEINESFHLVHALKHVQHTFFHTQDEEVVAGINAFVKRHQIQMVVMIARKHSVIGRIFREPHTKEMAFHTEVPLLVLRDH